MKLIDVYRLYMALAETEKANKALPFKLAWKIADIREPLQKHAVRLEQERLEIFKKYGDVTMDAAGTGADIKYKPEVAEELAAAMKELQDLEIEVKIEKIPLSVFEAATDLKTAAGAFDVFKEFIIDFEK